MRTNDDVEGWHGLLNRHTKRGNLTLTLLVKLLHEEAQLVDIIMHVRLASEEKLKRRQRKKYRQVKGKILAN